MRSNSVIRVRRMRFWGRHGVLAEERSSPQEIDVDVEVVADVSKAAASDRIGDAIDYDALYKICERVVTHQSFALLETLAQTCLHEIMADRRIERATVRVRKPDLLSGATPEVEVTQVRDA